jgi:hypothetical protein
MKLSLPGLFVMVLTFFSCQSAQIKKIMEFSLTRWIFRYRTVLFDHV